MRNQRSQTGNKEAQGLFLTCTYIVLLLYSAPYSYLYNMLGSFSHSICNPKLIHAVYWNFHLNIWFQFNVTVDFNGNWKSNSLYLLPMSIFFLIKITKLSLWNLCFPDKGVKKEAGSYPTIGWLTVLQSQISLTSVKGSFCSSCPKSIHLRCCLCIFKWFWKDVFLIY